MNSRFLLLMAGFFTGLLFGQDPVLIQPEKNTIMYNPALAGAEKCSYGPAGVIQVPVQYQALHKINYTGINYDRHVFSWGGAVGIAGNRYSILSDKINTYSIAATYSYLLPLFRNKYAFNLGISPGWEFRNIASFKSGEMTQLFREQFMLPDSLTAAIHSNYFTLGAGILFRKFTKWWGTSTRRDFRVGFSIRNWNRPAWEGDGMPGSRKPVLIQAHAEYEFIRWMHKHDFNDKIYVTGYYRNQAGMYEIQSGFLAEIKNWIAHLKYRNQYNLHENQQGIIAGLARNIKSILSVYYSGNYNFKTAGLAAYGTHMITVQIRYCIPPGLKPFRPLITPEF